MKKLFILFILLLFNILSCSDDSSMSSHFMPRSDGSIDACTEDITIAYQKWEYRGEADATLVFLNGRTEYTDKYHHLIDMFDSKPWDIIMFDHYGQGRSGGPRAHADDFDEQHVCDLKKIIDELADPDIPLAIVAHSMGGFVATRFAQLYPDEAVCLVLSSPMYGIPLPGGIDNETGKALALSFINAGKGEEHSSESSERPPCEENEVTHDCELYDKFKDDPLTMIGQPTWGWGYAALTGFDSLFMDAAYITIPILIMQAGEETVVIPEKQDEFCDLLGSEICSLITFENDLHELFNETDRDEVVEETLNFIESALAL